MTYRDTRRALGVSSVMDVLNRGFTLIELMIAVAIIAILVAIGIPQYQNYVARAQATEGINLASGIKTALAEFYNINGTFPAGTADANVELGVESASTIVGKYIDGVVVSNDGLGMITASFGSGTHIGKYVRLRAVVADGSIYFECDSDIEESYRSSECGESTDSTELTVAFRQANNLNYFAINPSSHRPIIPPPYTPSDPQFAINQANGYLGGRFSFATQMRRAVYFDAIVEWLLEYRATAPNLTTRLLNNRTKRDLSIAKAMGIAPGSKPSDFDQLAAEWKKLLEDEWHYP